MRKSTKPKPLWFPEPAAFLGRRTVFNSPNVLRGGGKNRSIIQLTRSKPSSHTVWIKKRLGVCDQYQKSSRISLTVAWKGTLRTRILDPVCFFSTCFFLRDTWVVLHTGIKTEWVVTTDEVYMPPNRHIQHVKMMKSFHQKLLFSCTVLLILIPICSILLPVSSRADNIL